MSRWQPALLDDGAASGLILVCRKQQFLACGDRVLFSAEELATAPIEVIQSLGRFDGRPVQLAEMRQPHPPDGGSWVGLRQLLRDDVAPDLLRLLSFASQIETWLSQHRFCGSCGQRLVQMPGERAMRCEPCDAQHYPRLSPCMITLVTRGDEVLLARSSRHPPGMFSTLAGFVEPGETVEQCVAREVFEEVGVAVRNLRYLGSQNWPFPHALMLGFQAEYVGGDIVPQPGEIEQAQWFSVRQLPALPSRHSIARYLIDRYVAERLGFQAPEMPNW